MTPPGDKKPRKGGPPTYTPEAAARRASGQIAVRLTPEQATRLRQLAAGHPGGVSGLVGSWVDAAAVPLALSGARALVATPGPKPKKAAAKEK